MPVTWVSGRPRRRPPALCFVQRWPPRRAAWAGSRPVGEGRGEAADVPAGGLPRDGRRPHRGESDRRPPPPLFGPDGHGSCLTPGRPPTAAAAAPVRSQLRRVPRRRRYVRRHAAGVCPVTTPQTSSPHLPSAFPKRSWQRPAPTCRRAGGPGGGRGEGEADKMGGEREGDRPRCSPLPPAPAADVTARWGHACAHGGGGGGAAAPAAASGSEVTSGEAPGQGGGGGWTDGGGGLGHAGGICGGRQGAHCGAAVAEDS